MGGSRFGPPVLFDARDGAGHVRLAIDHVALIHHDRRDGGDAQAPCVGDALVCGGDATLEVSVPLAQPALHHGGCLFGIGGQRSRKLRFDPGRLIQLDQPLATHGLDRVAAVGDDYHIGGESGWAEHGQDAGSATARPRVRQPDANLDRDVGMTSAPKSCQGP
ncbi:hypothetical protein SDC9_106858 [bioreactor metagenome]|uniref:Uncharacterized protein n=1 Tax=bioreactor metagenome TaxID=1076179 RepID=A0A645B5X1_9ZZZZ